VVNCDKIIVPFPTPSGNTTCSDSTSRKDLWAGSYFNYFPKASDPNFTPIQDIESIDDCFQQCAQEPNCNAFAFYDGPCILYLGDTKMCDTMEGDVYVYWYAVFTSISIEGQQTCSDDTCKKDMLDGKWSNCNGNDDFMSQSVESVEDCANNCINEPGCRYFTYFDDGDCDLFVTNGGVCSPGNTNQSTGSFYRFGASGLISEAAAQTDFFNAILPSFSSSSSSGNTGIVNIPESNGNGNDHSGAYVGLSIAVGVIGFFVVVLLGVLITLLINQGKQKNRSDDYNVSLLKD